MGREVLYVVDTGIGYVRLLEQGSAIAHTIGERVNSPSSRSTRFFSIRNRPPDRGRRVASVLDIRDFMMPPDRHATDTSPPASEQA